MKCIHLPAAVAATVLALSGAQAQTTKFTHSYEADEMPQNATNGPLWIELHHADAGGAGTSSAVDGVLTITTAPSESLIYRLAGGKGLAWDPTDAGNTVEVRLKVDSQNGRAGAGSLEIRTGKQHWGIIFYTKGVGIQIGTGSPVVMDTTDGFHTYRFVFSGNGDPLKLYVDDGASPVATWEGVEDKSTLLDFGTTITDVGGQVLWDYIRWTNQGAFEPAP